MPRKKGKFKYVFSKITKALVERTPRLRFVKESIAKNAYIDGYEEGLRFMEKIYGKKKS